MKPRRSLLVTLAAALLLGHAGAHAQDWPARPVKILVGFPAGSTPDMVARAVAEPLSRGLGQPVVVENRPGAAGNISANAVAKAADDHTLGLVINGNLATAKALDPRLPFDPAKDFAHLSLLATSPLLLVAPADLPGGAEFIAEARRAGGKWSYGSVGSGSMAHLGIEVLKTKVAGLAPVHVPYRGNPDVALGLARGEIQMALMPPGVAMPQVQAGRIRAIGVAGPATALVPNVPSLAQAGVADFTLEVWNGLVGPAGLSAAARERLAAELARIFEDPALRKRLADLGWQAVGSSGDEFRRRAEAEAAVLGGIIAAQGIKAD